MLSKHQEQVVQSFDDHIVVIAGPGTGKTHTIIQKVKLILNNSYERKLGIIVCTLYKKSS
jgi:superfamily I DNA/RNA helicase